MKKISVITLVAVVLVTVAACSGQSTETFKREYEDWFDGSNLVEWFRLSGDTFTFGVHPNDYSKWNVKGTYFIADNSIELKIEEVSGDFDAFSMLGLNAVKGHTMTFPYSRNGDTIIIDSTTDDWVFTGKFEFSRVN